MSADEGGSDIDVPYDFIDDELTPTTPPEVLLFAAAGGRLLCKPVVKGRRAIGDAMATYLGWVVPRARRLAVVPRGKLK